MTTEISIKAKWPSIICALSVIYVLLYAAMYARPPETGANWFSFLQNFAICILLFSGSTGVGLRRKWGVPLLIIGAILVLGTVAFALFSIILAMGVMPIVVLLGILTGMLLTLVWPGFLMYWFSRSSVRSMIQEQWA